MDGHGFENLPRISPNASVLRRRSVFAAERLLRAHANRFTGNLPLVHARCDCSRRFSACGVSSIVQCTVGFMTGPLDFH